MMSFCQDIYDMLCKKYPNSAIYLISDHHFCHNNIIYYTRTEFSSVEEMHQCIIKEHNQTIGEDDIVIFLGDFCFKNSFMRVLDSLNGHKYLILGNHDQPYLVKNYPTLGFEGVYKTPVKLDGDFLSHEPLIEGERSDIQFDLIAKEFAKVSAMNYHGHIHTEDRLDPSKYTNVTCEALHYKPLLVGHTKEIEKPVNDHFINADAFASELVNVANQIHLNPRIILKDYLYAYMLEAINHYQKQFFIQGSYGLYKKYGFASDFSDIDISMLYHPEISKNANIARMKKLVDSAYESLKDIDGINLSFYKRYSSLRIFEAIYTSKNPYFAKCYMDANLVPLDAYRDSDFYLYEGQTSMGKCLSKTNPSLLEEYHFPVFKSNVIIPEADMANLLLQLLFQVDIGNKKWVIIKKLQYIFATKYDKKNIDKLRDIFTRFFLRNICLLHAMNRLDEIRYIQECLDHVPELLNILPDNIKNVMRLILDSDNSEFLDIFAEIAKVDAHDTLSKSNELIKVLK